MKINTLLERVDSRLEIITEMPLHEFRVIMASLEKEFKKYGFSMEITKHFKDYAIYSNDPERTRATAADVYKTIKTFLDKHGERLANHPKKTSKKRHTIAVTNTRTYLTINMVFDFHHEPKENSDVPYNMALQSLIVKRNYGMDDNPVDHWIRIRV